MEVNTKILGTIHQALSPTILHWYQFEHVAANLIKALKYAYGAQELLQVYTDFKVMMESHPDPTFTRFQTLFTKLSQAKYMIPDNIQAMIVLSCLPHIMLVIVQLLA